MEKKVRFIDYTAWGRWNDSAISEKCHEPHLWPFCCCQKVQLWQLLRAIAAGNIVERSDTSKHFQWRPPLVHHPFYFCHCSDPTYLRLLSAIPFFSLVFFQCFLSFLSFVLFTHILSICPISSVSSAAVYPWLHASHLSAQTTACIVPKKVSLGSLLNIQLCLCTVYLFSYIFENYLRVECFFPYSCWSQHTLCDCFVCVCMRECLWALGFSLEWGSGFFRFGTETGLRSWVIFCVGSSYLAVRVPAGMYTKIHKYRKHLYQDY